MLDCLGSTGIVQTNSTGLCVGWVVDVGPVAAVGVCVLTASAPELAAAVGGCAAGAVGIGPQAAPYRTIAVEINTNKMRVFMYVAPWMKLAQDSFYHNEPVCTIRCQ